jgi:DNA helicase-2/ATP-dependent DNA helicase PcrA
MNFTAEQQAIFEAIKNKTNLIINAVAGSGKTTTIVEGLKYIPSDKSVLFLAFNKSIEKELTHKLAPFKNVQVKTLHSLGFTIFKENRRGFYKVDAHKYTNSGYLIKKETNFDFLDEYYGEDYNQKSDFKNRVFDIVHKARLTMSLDENSIKENVINHYNIITHYNEIEVALNLIKKGSSGKFLSFPDYTDMLFYPNYFNCETNTKFDYIFLDEAQDASILAQNLIKKVMKPDTTFIAVGDVNQAIYGFAGADSKSFENIKTQFNSIELPLTINYRCAKSIIEVAQKYVPQITAHENATEGEVITQGKNSDIQKGDMVLCRNVAPLVAFYFDYIVQTGDVPVFLGKDIIKALIEKINNFHENEISGVLQVLEQMIDVNLQVLYKRGLKKEQAMQDNTIADIQDIISLVSRIRDAKKITLTSQLLEVLTPLLEQKYDGENIPSDKTIFATIHKAKGLERGSVHLLEFDYAPSGKILQEWEVQQELNLKYVAVTRAKNKLVYNTEYTFYKREK